MTDSKKHTPNPIDVKVGAALARMRKMRGISLEKLGEALGLSFQQIQKYENGQNRVSASKLYALSRILGVPITDFFADVDDADKVAAPDAAAIHAVELDRHHWEMVRLYDRCPTRIQNTIRSFLRDIAPDGSPQP